MIKALEGKNLGKNDREFLQLIKTQLKKDWRGPLVRYLDRMLKKYSRSIHQPSAPARIRG
ncbi:MAG: hypothetical protein HYW27_02775 [Candidatus Aenigmarchaeota archaeon]|nr:hypothetical protein [Candidatus Aenigmarchaeota archaeon]